MYIYAGPRTQGLSLGSPLTAPAQGLTSLIPSPRHMTASRRLPLIPAALTLLTAAALPAGGQTPTDSAIAAIVQDRVATRRSVGLVVATVDRGKTTVFTAGSSGTNGLALGVNTVFEIGSITKVFTAALLADMVARGEVKLEDPHRLPPTC